MSPAKRRGIDGNRTGSQKRPRHQRSPSPLVPGDVGDDVSGTERSRRRRAPIACRACRARKVKCSNDRPTCAGCVRLNCECVYPEPLRYGQEVIIEQDNAQLAILQEILQRLPPLSRNHQITPSSSLEGYATAEIISGLPRLAPRLPPLPNANEALVGTSSGLTSLDYIFEWPLFRSNRAEHFKGIVLAADQLQTLQQDTTQYKHVTPGLGVPFLDGDEISILLKRFLQLTHVMNPVLDCTGLSRYGKEIAELGPQWDAKTCLVLLAAALGVLAKPFNPTSDTAESLATSSSKENDLQARQRAESYYEYARRRFGLLDRSLTACHCHFLCGIYLMYTLRPVQAWQSFFEASSLYTVYLKSKSAARAIEGRHNSRDDLRCRLEQRLYWSCIKSESEICAEIELPRSSLHTLEYPCQFPSPPSPKSTSGLIDDNYSGTTSSTRTMSTPGGPPETNNVDKMEENSWFHYLSEISLLRLSSRVNHTFYTEPPSFWASMNLLDMLNAAWDFEKQLQQWQEVLPPAISCFVSPLEFARVTELQLATWSRYTAIKLRLYRPFLYRFAGQYDRDRPLRESLQAMAKNAVLICLDPLFTLGLRHRHAGTWYKCRETAARALVLLCAKKIGLTGIMDVEERVDVMLSMCLAHLRYWEGEAADLRVARETIERIMAS